MWRIRSIEIRFKTNLTLWMVNRESVALLYSQNVDLGPQNWDFRIFSDHYCGSPTESTHMRHIRSNQSRFDANLICSVVLSVAQWQLARPYITAVNRITEPTPTDLMHVVTANPLSVYTVDFRSNQVTCLDLYDAFPAIRGTHRPQVTVAALGAPLEHCVVIHEGYVSYWHFDVTETRSRRKICHSTSDAMHDFGQILHFFANFRNFCTWSTNFVIPGTFSSGTSSYMCDFDLWNFGDLTLDDILEHRHFSWIRELGHFLKLILSETVFTLRFRPSRQLNYFGLLVKSELKRFTNRDLSYGIHCIFQSGALLQVDTSTGDVTRVNNASLLETATSFLAKFSRDAPRELSRMCTEFAHTPDVMLAFYRLKG